MKRLFLSLLAAALTLSCTVAQAKNHQSRKDWTGYLARVEALRDASADDGRRGIIVMLDVERAFRSAPIRNLAVFKKGRPPANLEAGQYVLVARTPGQEIGKPVANAPEARSGYSLLWFGTPQGAYPPPSVDPFGPFENPFAPRPPRPEKPAPVQEDGALPEMSDEPPSIDSLSDTLEHLLDTVPELESWAESALKEGMDAEELTFAIQNLVAREIEQCKEQGRGGGEQLEECLRESSVITILTGPNTGPHYPRPGSNPGRIVW